MGNYEKSHELIKNGQNLKFFFFEIFFEIFLRINPIFRLIKRKKSLKNENKNFIFFRFITYKKCNFS